MAFDILFILILAVSLLFGLLTGTGGSLSSALLEGAGQAVTLCISMAGPLCLWSGLLEVMERCGAAQGLRRLIARPIKRLLPHISSETTSCVCVNIAANILGLGNAATPAGVKAASMMTDGQDLGTFLLLNTCSVQLLPATIAAVRSACGAGAPFDILLPVWLSSLCALAAALGLDCVFRGKER